jgi:hypothetical protein
MSDNYISLAELSKLFDKEFVSKEKVNAIKILRSITGEGLRETKDYLEQRLIPFIVEGKPMASHADFDANYIGVGQHISSAIPAGSEDLTPPMFLIGHTYRQLNKETVLIVGASNQGTSYETVYSINPEGRAIHRYNRRDFGRCTGTNHMDPSELNLEVVT